MKTSVSSLVLIVFFLFIVIMLSSCDFRIVKHVGSQYSSDIKVSKQFKVYVASYKPIISSVEKHKKYGINEVFSEHQYSHDGGFFSGFQVDNNMSQVILTHSFPNQSCLNDICKFDIRGFQHQNADLFYYPIPSTSTSDTLKLTIVLSDFEYKETVSDLVVYVKEK